MKDCGDAQVGQGTAVEVVAAAAATVARRPPPILAGTLTPEVYSRVEGFYSGVAEIFERWVRRCVSPHTRRSYRDGVMSFVRYLGLVWPS